MGVQGLRVEDWRLLLSEGELKSVAQKRQKNKIHEKKSKPYLEVHGA